MTVDKTPSRLSGGLTEPKSLLTLLGCALMMFACMTNVRLGPHAVAFKFHYAQWFSIFAVVLAARRAMDASARVWTAGARSAWTAAPLFVAFCVLVGVHGLVSNGLDYQSMATDYWHVDPAVSTSRRLGLPALAHLLTLDLKLYVVFWYAVFAAAFWVAVHLLLHRGLTRLEALSVATSSILAYALEGPGYSEVAVLLLGIVLLRFRATTVEKAVAAAFMIATHETATPFVAATLVIASDGDERREWLAIFGLLYLALVASFVATWHQGLGDALLRAGKARAADETTSPELVAMYPGRAVLGALAAYKLYWIPAVAALGPRSSRPMAALTFASLALILIGSDTSRLVQFGSLPLFLAVSTEVRRWSASARRRLAVANLLVPSVYVATNAGVLWGPGLYSLYLRSAGVVGISLGRVFDSDDLVDLIGNYGCHLIFMIKHQ